MNKQQKMELRLHLIKLNTLSKSFSTLVTRSLSRQRRGVQEPACQAPGRQGEQLHKTLLKIVGIFDDFILYLWKEQSFISRLPLYCPTSPLFLALLLKLNIMKRGILTLLVSLGFLLNTSGQALSQETNQSTQELYDFHINKKNANNLAAWITLGGGVAMFIGGLAINVTQVLGSLDETNNGLWLSYLGGATALISIPLFIAKGKHKRKAQIQLQNGAIGLSGSFSYSGLSITFSL